MDFSWNVELVRLKEKTIKFAEDKLNKSIINRDKNSEFSSDLWKECANCGLLGMPIDKEYGGQGFDVFTIITILEGLGYGCKDNGLIFSIGAHTWATEIPIFHFGTDKQKEKYLPKLCNGEWVGAHGITELESGSDISSLKTVAEKKNGYYLLNGAKTYVTNSPIADVFVVYASTSGINPTRGISCFVVDKNIDGLAIGGNVVKMGLKTSPMSEIRFNNCKVPIENLIGKEGSGKIVFFDSMEWERCFISASYIGVMERQISLCIDYANNRTVMGCNISKFQSISNKIVDMKLNLETSRLMLYKTAWLKGNKHTAFLESAMTKLLITEAFYKSSREAIQIHGASGYMESSELERDLRDAVGGTLYSGTSEVLRNITASLIGLK